MLIKSALIILAFVIFSFRAEAASLIVDNKSDQAVKVSSIGGGGKVAANSKQEIQFNNDERGADINIWWVKNARQLCNIYTPWDRTITVTGTHTIYCMSRQ